MSRWLALYLDLTTRGTLTDSDTPRHTGSGILPTATFEPPVCRGVSLSVNGTKKRFTAPASDTTRWVFVDFETRNIGGCDLTKAGAWRYAADPATAVICLGYRVDGADHLWTPDNGLGDLLLSFATDPSMVFVSFAGFEQAVWQRIMVARFGFPEIPTARWHDARAACSHYGLPKKLEKVLPVLGLPVEKDAAGQRFVRSLSRRNRQGPRFSPA